MTNIYKLIYRSTDGEIKELMVYSNPLLSPDEQFQLTCNCLKERETPLRLVSKNSCFPNFCFVEGCKTEDPFMCSNCRFTKDIEKADDNRLPLKSYVFVGLFYDKDTRSERREVRKIIKADAPPQITSVLEKELTKKFFDELPKGKKYPNDYWCLVSVYLERILKDESSIDVTKDKFVWVRTSDVNEVYTAWIPAIVRGGEVLSAIGELTSPDSENDTRDFVDSPFEEYVILDKDKYTQIKEAADRWLELKGIISRS